MLRFITILTICLMQSAVVWCLGITAEVDSISCNGRNDGKILVKVTECKQLYTIRLMEAKNNRLLKRSDLFSDTVITFSDLKANRYVLQIIFDGKSEEQTLEVAEPTKLKGNAVIEQFPTTKETCDGIIYVEPAGGKKPYSYKWNDGGPGLDSQRIIGLCEKIYSCELTDSNGCSEMVSTAFLFKEEPVKAKN
jgi:hypothetical protein